MGEAEVYMRYVLQLVLSAMVSAYAVKKIIFITRSHKIYDIPDDTRKIHGTQIPSLGGIGIFAGYIGISTLFNYNDADLLHFTSPLLLLFFTGIYDDLMNMRPLKKLLSQLLASFIAVYVFDVRPDTLYGFLGIGSIPYIAGIALTTLACTFFINVFNFIDGIDGLACAMAILYSLLLAGAYHLAGCVPAAGIMLCLAGASLGLLLYNRPPARIYMGDTGSMFVGFSIFVYSMLFIRQLAPQATSNSIPNGLKAIIHTPQSAILLIIAMLYLPVFDALRVFILRASRGISPLRADRTHLHYYLLDAGFSHGHSVIILLGGNVAILLIAWLMQDVGAYMVLAAITVFALGLMGGVYKLRQQRMKGNITSVK